MDKNFQQLSGNTRLSSADFEIVRSLGKGASGEVYLARSRHDGGKLVALKVLKNPEAFDELTLRRFQAEVSVLKTLSHPNIIQAFDYFEFNGDLAYTMEHVEGSDLARLLSGRQLSYEQIDTIVLQILEALHELHSNNILHRDIKLENVLVSTEGLVKLGDLGLMKRSDTKSVTRSGIVLGTAPYMAPEYIKKGVYDEGSDLYAVGVILLELLSGKRRLAGVPENKAMEYLIRNKFALDQAVLHLLPSGYQQIIERATAIDPNQRYRSAVDMRYDILSYRSALQSGLIGSIIDSEEPNPSHLLPWNQEIPKGSRILYWTTGVLVSAISVLLVNLYPSLKPRMELVPGTYRGGMRLEAQTVAPMTLDVEGGQIYLSNASLECDRSQIALDKKSFFCGKESYRIFFEASPPNTIKGYLLRRGEAIIREFKLVLG